MAQEITLEVGDLYAQLHERFGTEVGEQYDERLRQEVEEFVHKFNQEVERQREQAQATDLDEDE
jgi:NAD(P)H-dependent FMN reductase